MALKQEKPCSERAGRLTTPLFTIRKRAGRLCNLWERARSIANHAPPLCGHPGALSNHASLFPSRLSLGTTDNRPASLSVPSHPSSVGTSFRCVPRAPHTAPLPLAPSNALGDGPQPRRAAAAHISPFTPPLANVAPSPVTLPCRRRRSQSRSRRLSGRARRRSRSSSCGGASARCTRRAPPGRSPTGSAR